MTKVSILGGDDPVLNPLMNLEVKVGPQETPEDYSCSNLVDTNQRRVVSGQTESILMVPGVEFSMDLL